jgi:hypothetical protein
MVRRAHKTGAFPSAANRTCNKTEERTENDKKEEQKKSEQNRRRERNRNGKKGRNVEGGKNTTSIPENFCNQSTHTFYGSKHSSKELETNA